MLKKILCIITCVIMMIPAVPCKAAEEEKREYECSYSLMEVTTGTVIRERDSHKRVRMGSFNKLMIVLLAAESMDRGELSLDTQITASENANSKQGAQIWLSVGEKMTLSDLLKAIIIGNANDAACAVAEKLGGTEDHFVMMMNSRAAELSMNDTLFTESTGYYDDENQYTTAHDAALLLCELAHHTELREMFTTRLDELKEGQVQLVTTNRMAHHYKGSVGFKCGFGPSSGYFAAEGAQCGDMTCVASVMDCPEEDTALALAAELLDIAFRGYTIIKPKIPENMPESISVKEGTKTQVQISVGFPEVIVVPKGSEDSIKPQIVLPGYIYAPLPKGRQIGELRLYNGKKLLISCPVNTVEIVKKKSILSVLDEMMKFIVSF